MLLRGAFLAYNAINDQNRQALTQCRHLNLNQQLIRPRTAVVRTCCLSKRGKVLAVATGEPSTSQQPSETVSLDYRLPHGGSTEKGVYTEKLIVRRCEVGFNKTATIQTIANYLQEVVCAHAQLLGYSADGFATTHTMRKLNLIWVVARMRIEILKYPAWSDVVEVASWGHVEGRTGYRCDWTLKNNTTGEAIGRATSKWVLMNQDTRRLQKVVDEIRDECEPFQAPKSRLAFPEENNSSLKKIPKLEDPTQYSSLGLVPRLVDLDMNQHVSNIAYIDWILESMPQEIIDTHDLQSITLDYRRECKRDDVVDSLTSLEPINDASIHGSNGSATPTSTTGANNGNESTNFLHLLRFSGNGLEINRGRSEWKKKPSKI